jgi:prevent-host-death family protein
MPDQPPMVQTFDIDLDKHQLSTVIQRVSHKEARVLVEQSGVLVAAIVSIEDLERLQQLDQEWEQTTQAIARLSQAVADIPVADL